MGRSRKRGPGMGQPVAFLLGGLPVAAVGGVTAWALSRATMQSGGVVLVPVWLLFSLGVVAVGAGVFDLVRALSARLAGQAVPPPAATTWFRAQTGLS